MKLLFDQNISFRILKKLSLIFEQSNHISNFGLMDTEDLLIWEFAKKEEFVIVTFDSDFYDISLINGCPPKIIWLRSGNLTTIKVAEILENKHLIIRDFINNPEKKYFSCLEID